MKRPGLLQGITVSAALALLTAIALAAAPSAMATPVFVRLLAPLIALAYLAFLLRCSAEKTGRVTLLSAWLVVSAASWWLVPSLTFYLLIHAGMIWLIRSLYFYAGILPALMDLGLTWISVAAFTACTARTGNLALATWCFFLMQALFVYLPADLRKRHASADAIDNRGFERARQQADNALRQLMS